jgi:hypothetical protein
MKTMEERIFEQIEATKEVQAISFVALSESGQIDAEVASAHSDMFEEWGIGINYKAGQIRKYEDKLYKIIQDHTSQTDWLPLNTPTLYDPLVITESGYEEWKKPTGAHNAYNKGKIVVYNGKLYKSLIDGNVYSPDEYPSGWELYEE